MPTRQLQVSVQRVGVALLVHKKKPKRDRSIPALSVFFLCLVCGAAAHKLEEEIKKREKAYQLHISTGAAVAQSK